MSKGTRKIERFNIYGRADASETGELYDVDTVHEALIKAIRDNITDDDVIKNICELFGIYMSPKVNIQTESELNSHKLPAWCEDAVDNIDAGFFSGDTFHSADALNRIEFFLERWKREIQNIKKLIAEEPYFLKKNGMYYAHNNCGYASNPLMAEIYTKEDAIKYAKQSNGDVVAIPFSKTGYTKDHINAYLSRMDKMYAFADSPDRAT